jgi:hypothetical protein
LLLSIPGNPACGRTFYIQGYIIDLEDMIDDVPDAKVFYDREVTKVKHFVGTLPIGTHHITTN